MAIKDRIEYLDTCKAIAILGMIIGHIGLNVYLPNAIVHFITAWHMPIFFIISGFLFDTSLKKNFRSFLKRKAATLLLPYFIYGILSWLLYIAFSYLTNPEKLSEAVRSVYYVFTYNTVFFPISGALWFLTAMFFAQILYYLLVKVCNERFYLVGAVALLLAVATWIFAKTSQTRLPLGIDCAIGCILFLWFGSMFRYFFEKLHKIKIPFLLIGGILSICLIFCNSDSNVRTLKYGNPVLFYLNAILFSTILILLAGKTVDKFKNSFLQFVGENSIVFLIFNQLILAFVYRLFDKICAGIFWLWELLISLVIVVIGCCVLTLLINRYFAYTLGKRNKK